MPRSADFKSAAQHSFRQQSQGAGSRHSPGSFFPLLNQAAPSQTPFLRGPFAGTVFDPATRPNSGSVLQAPNQLSSGASAALDPTAGPADTPSGKMSGQLSASAETQDGFRALRVQAEAAAAAAQDKHAAEQFALGALQLPKAEPQDAACTMVGASPCVPTCRALLPLT